MYIHIYVCIYIYKHKWCTPYNIEYNNVQARPLATLSCIHIHTPIRTETKRLQSLLRLCPIQKSTVRVYVCSCVYMSAL